jgi:hypothetical protein
MRETKLKKNAAFSGALFPHFQQLLPLNVSAMSAVSDDDDADASDVKLDDIRYVPGE